MDINPNLKKEEAVELFKLIKQNNLLPATIDKLVPLSFIGQAAVSYYRSKIKLMDQLNMTEAQRKATLRDGQEAGEMLLDIELRIGELAEKEEKAITKPPKGTPRGGGALPSGVPPKHERIGIPVKRMHEVQQMAKHPEIVERIKAKARETEDIPTRTAVVSEIRYENEKKRRKVAEGKKEEIKAVVAIDQVLYIEALEKCLRTLPQKPPKRWEEGSLKMAKTLVKLIMKRLEVFNG